MGVTREQYIAAVRQLEEEGRRLQAAPSLSGLRTWIALSDELLRTAWGSMDRYHLSWLMVGRPPDAVRGRAMTGQEEADYVREVSAAKTIALQLSRRAVEDGVPFLGEDEPSLGQDEPSPGRRQRTRLSPTDRGSSRAPHGERSRRARPRRPPG
jgi:hypothetical protein